MTLKTPASSPPLGRGWEDPRFQDGEGKQKAQRILLLSGLSCLLIGLVLAACHTALGRNDLAVFFALFAVTGLAAIACIRRCDHRHMVVVTHAMLLLVTCTAAIDAPTAAIPRSAHLFYLPLAAAAVFVFGSKSRYMGELFPALCVVLFVLFGARLLGVPLPEHVPPPAMRFGWSVLNNIASAALLAGVLIIYRTDKARQVARARDLAKAVSGQQIQLVYQPQVCAQGRPIGAEALVRWQHPTRGLLGPQAFIPLAEETHLIHDIGLEVLRQACLMLRRWDADPALRTLTIAVNVSPVQLYDPDFASAVQRVLDATGADPARLELELTESALGADRETARATMWRLRDMGIAWALDDFGTGFSSLSLLRTLPVQKIKIDRRFVADADDSESGRLLLAKIIEISDVLGMAALAEGVEQASQQQMLVALGCRRFQGFLFSRPLTEDAITGYLRDTAGKPLR